MPGNVLNTAHAIINLMSKMILGSKEYYYSHFIIEETGPERLTNKFKVIQPISNCSAIYCCITNHPQM